MANKVLILANNSGGLFNFRKDLLVRLIAGGFEVCVSVPNDKYNIELTSLGCTVIDAPINRRGTGVLEETKLLKHYYKFIKSMQPDVILSYTIKPNIYGGIVAKRLNIPYLPNVTGLGTALNEEGLLKKILIRLYKYSFSDARNIFFQNTTNQNFFFENKIIANETHSKLLPGSGVNIDKYNVLEYPGSEEVNFVFISRIMKDKGIDHYLEAAKYIKKNYANTNFHICGSYEEDYKNEIEKLHKKGVIIYHGPVPDVRVILQNMHCIIHPSYHEGMSNVLLEAAASGRPVIASDIPGCRETFDEGVSGFSFPAKDTKALMNTIERFIHLDNDERIRMGLAGRRKMEEEFDRQIVVDAYMEEINKVMKED